MRACTEAEGEFFMTINQTYQVTGMTCAACANRIEKRLRKVQGVQEVHVNLTTNKARVAFDPAQTNDQEIMTKIEQLGFSASLKQAELQEEKSCCFGGLFSRLF